MPAFKDWPQSIKFTNGETGEYMGVCRSTGRHRVFQANAGQWGTVWTLDDNGICNTAGVAGSPHDRVA